MRVLMLFLLTFTSFQAIGQNYVIYHQTFNRIDEDIIQNNYDLALVRLDSIYINYDFIYARHCIKALQISCFVGDSVKANKWLEKSFKQGIPQWILRSNGLTKRAFYFSTTINTIQNFDSLNAIYNMSINTNLANQIDSLLLIDQKYTKKVNDGFFLFRYTIYGLSWVKNNKKQFKIINKIINEYGFPGERLIGLDRFCEDSIAMAQKINFWGPDILNEGRTYIMLLHYFSTSHKKNYDFQDKLLQNLINGYIPSYQYGNICDFISGRKNKRYSIDLIDNKMDSMQVINGNRFSIGLNSVDQEKRNVLINREYRKNKRANSEIILE